MKQLLSAFFVVFACSSMVFGQSTNLKDPNKRDVRGISKVNAFNVKTMPAFYWDCVGLEFEYPLTEAITVGVNVLAKYGRTDDGINLNFKIRPEDFQDPGIRTEFALKYYFPYSKKVGYNAPVGLYLQGNVAYSAGTNHFFDGTSRPYTFGSRWKYSNKSVVDPRTPQPLIAPVAFNFGGGVGYQVIVIPNHIIANIMLGTNIYFPSEGGFNIYPAFYASPSIGYVF